MKTVFLFCLLLVISANLNGQTDTTKIRNVTLPLSNTELIAKYRNLILDNVIANDKVKTNELFKAAIEKYDNEYFSAFYPSEKWILCFWLKDYDLIINESLKTDSLSYEKKNKRIRPNNDQLFEILTQTLENRKDEFRQELATSALKDEEKSFLELILKTLTTTYNQNYQETINSAATSFLTSYPDNRFSVYTRNFVRFGYKPKGFSFGMELYSGASILSGGTLNYFNSGAILGVGFIWGFGNFQVNSRAAFIFSRLKSDIPTGNNIWSKGEKAELFTPELSVHYVFKVDKKTTISPILGLCWFSAAPYEQDQKTNIDLNGIEINAKAGPIIGIDFGHNLINTFYNTYYHKPKYAYYSWNFRYTLQQVNFSGGYKNMNGLAHTLALSFKFGVGGARRVY